MHTEITPGVRLLTVNEMYLDDLILELQKLRREQGNIPVEIKSKNHCVVKVHSVPTFRVTSDMWNRRRKGGLTCRKLQKLTGVTASRISDIERGRVTPLESEVELLDMFLPTLENATEQTNEAY